MYISITKTTHPGTLLPSDQLGFGIHYTDHMFIMDYSDEKGWYDPRIVPFQNISLSPAACVFHYGAEVFEGLKAYRRPDGEVQLFRPWDNMERMKNSAIRLGLPVVPPENALEAVKALVKVDERWVPSDPGTSLYIRPFLYGTDAKLGLHGVHTAQFIIILSPVGSYFDNGMEPVKIIVETEDVRAVRGGTGEAKCGGNYGACQRLFSSTVAGRRGAQVCGGRRRHERGLQDQRQDHHPHADRVHPPRRHPPLLPPIV